MEPSWSPDGTELAVGQSDGIHVFGNIPDLRTATPICGQITERVVAKGSYPAWGPADVPNDGPLPPPPVPDRRVIADLAVAKRRKGRVVRVRLRVIAAGATVRARLRAVPRKATMGSAVKRAAKPGTLTLKVRLNKRGRAALVRRGRVRLSVQVTATAPGAARTSESRRVMLRRR